MARLPEILDDPLDGRIGKWHPAMILCTWFGSGWLPRVPGTWGSLAALPFAWIIAATGGPAALVPAALVVFLVGVLASDRVVKTTEISDPYFIVIDEVAGQWLTLAVVPPDPIYYGIGFVLFRIADILKPWPASWADREVGGGLGVMLDDVLAAGYSVLILWGVRLLGWF